LLFVFVALALVFDLAFLVVILEEDLLLLLSSPILPSLQVVTRSKATSIPAIAFSNAKPAVS
jgi:hypothetical protein